MRPPLSLGLLVLIAVDGKVGRKPNLVLLAPRGDGNLTVRRGVSDARIGQGVIFERRLLELGRGRHGAVHRGDNQPAEQRSLVGSHDVMRPRGRIAAQR